MSPWIKHVMKFKKPGMSLGDAMKAAGPSWKGMRKTQKGKGEQQMGGTAGGFTGGPYTGSDLADGMSRFPSLPDATWQWRGAAPPEVHRRQRRGGDEPDGGGGDPRH
jgi:hypothetical protein